MSLKQLREKRKLTIRAVAELMGISPSYLSMLENGKRSVKVEYLLKLAEIYKVSTVQVVKATERVVKNG